MLVTVNIYPDVISRLPWLYALALVPTLILVSIGSIRERLKRRSFLRTLGDLLALEDSNASDEANETRATKLYQELMEAKLHTAIEKSREFLAAAGRPGAHQLSCLRLVLDHPTGEREPWRSLVRTHEGVLRAAELESREKDWLDELTASTGSE